MAKSSSEWKCESIKANLAGGLSGILTYVRIREHAGLGLNRLTSIRSILMP
jgi:hypothetical protein